MVLLFCRNKFIFFAKTTIQLGPSHPVHLQGRDKEWTTGFKAGRAGKELKKQERESWDCEKMKVISDWKNKLLFPDWRSLLTLLTDGPQDLQPTT